MAIADAAGLPAAACLAGTSVHEVKLAEKLIGGKAYDSDKLDNDLLEKHGVEMTAPHRRNRTKPKTQVGRKLRRYQRRWKVGRLVVISERHADIFLAFLLLACSLILLRFLR